MITLNDGSLTIVLNWEFFKLSMVIVGSVTFALYVTTWVARIDRLRSRVAELEGEFAGQRRDTRKLQETVAGWDLVLTKSYRERG